MSVVDKITLPYTVKRGENMSIIIPVMIVQPLVIMAGLGVYLYSRNPVWDSLLPMLIAIAVLIPGEIIAAIFLLRNIRPAAITFNRGYITEAAIPIIGFSVAPEQTMEMADFAAVKLIASGNAQYVSMRLKRRNGADYLVRSMMDRASAEKLAQALGLPVEAA
jgi:uncharacterized protein (DUF983 family)